MEMREEIQNIVDDTVSAMLYSDESLQNFLRELKEDVAEIVYLSVLAEQFASDKKSDCVHTQIKLAEAKVLFDELIMNSTRAHNDIQVISEIRKSFARDYAELCMIQEEGFKETQYTKFQMRYNKRIDERFEMFQKIGKQV